MGVLPKHIHILARESFFNARFIHGDVITLGQQAVYATLPEVKYILKRHRIPGRLLPEGFDTTNKIPSWNNTCKSNRTNAQTVLNLLGASGVQVLDISDYENPDFIVDLNVPVDNSLRNSYDVVFDVGTLEHVFDIPAALKNIIAMLRFGGRAILILPASNSIDHGFYSFSPTMLWEFFEANGFSEPQCYLIENNPNNPQRRGRVWKYSGFGREYPLVTKRHVEVFFTAVKTKDVLYNTPIQKIYTQSGSETDLMKTLRDLRDATWEYIPEIVEDALTRIAVKHNNLEYVGRY